MTQTVGQSSGDAATRRTTGDYDFGQCQGKTFPRERVIKESEDIYKRAGGDSAPKKVRDENDRLHKLFEGQDLYIDVEQFGDDYYYVQRLRSGSLDETGMIDVIDPIRLVQFDPAALPMIISGFIFFNIGNVEIQIDKGDSKMHRIIFSPRPEDYQDGYWNTASHALVIPTCSSEGPITRSSFFGDDIISFFLGNRLVDNYDVTTIESNRNIYQIAALPKEWERPELAPKPRKEFRAAECADHIEEARSRPSALPISGWHLMKEGIETYIAVPSVKLMEQFRGNMGIQEMLVYDLSTKLQRSQFTRLDDGVFRYFRDSDITFAGGEGVAAVECPAFRVEFHERRRGNIIDDVVELLTPSERATVVFTLDISGSMMLPTATVIRTIGEITRRSTARTCGFLPN